MTHNRGWWASSLADLLEAKSDQKAVRWVILSKKCHWMSPVMASPGSPGTSSDPASDPPSDVDAVRSNGAKPVFPYMGMRVESSSTEPKAGGPSQSQSQSQSQRTSPSPKPNRRSPPDGLTTPKGSLTPADSLLSPADSLAESLTSVELSEPAAGQQIGVVTARTNGRANGHANGNANGHRKG
eukprot:1195410-Prorocentrum_minimum.AAC.1